MGSNPQHQARSSTQVLCISRPSSPESETNSRSPFTDAAPFYESAVQPGIILVTGLADQDAFPCVNIGCQCSVGLSEHLSALLEIIGNDRMFKVFLPRPHQGGRVFCRTLVQRNVSDQPRGCRIRQRITQCPVKPPELTGPRRITDVTERC